MTTPSPAADIVGADQLEAIAQAMVHAAQLAKLAEQAGDEALAARRKQEAASLDYQQAKERLSDQIMQWITANAGTPPLARP